MINYRLLQTERIILDTTKHNRLLAFTRFHVSLINPKLTTMYFVYPKKICIAIVSNFSWVLKSSQEKSKTMVFHFFLGGGGRGKQVVLLCMWKLWMAGLSGSQGTFEQIGCKKSRSRSYAAGSRLFRSSSMCPGSLKAAPQRRLGSFRILVIKHLGLEGKLASFPKQALLQNPPGQLKFRSIARPTIWLLLVACIARFLKELVINNYGKRMENKIYKLANK